MLKELYQLQKIELMERSVLNQRRESAEFQELKALKADFENKKAQYYQMTEEISALSAQIADFPRKIEQLKAKISEQNEALYSGSTNNLKEIAAREGQAAALQEKIEELQSISSLYAGEKQQKADAAQLLKQEVNAIYARFNQVKEDFAGKQQSWQEQLADLATDKEAMISVLSAAEVSWFDSIKDKFNGSPVALLSEAQVCGGCYTIVPAITFKRTRLGQQTYCEKCGRTLFVEE